MSDVDPPPPPKKGAKPPTNFRPVSIVAKRLDGSRWHSAWRRASVQATLCYMGTHLPFPQKGQCPQFSASFYCAQTAGCINMPLDMEVGLGPGHIVLDGDQAPQKRGHVAPIFGPCLLWPNVRMDQDAIWYRGMPQPRRHCIRWGLGTQFPQKGHSPQFSAHVYWGQMA